MDNDQPNLPLDERFRQAEQYTLDLQPPRAEQPATEIQKKRCPVHGTIEVCGCPYCESHYE